MRESGLSIKLGDLIAPAGLYASDHDCFIFMVNEDFCLDVNPKERMARGFFIRNSEVGDARLEITMFYYSFVCGNHIVWGAEDVRRVSIVHRGRHAQSYEGRIRNAVWQLQNRSANEDKQRVIAAKNLIIDADPNKVPEVIFRRQLGIGKKQSEDAMKLATQYADVHGDPRSAWGFAAGITRLSQSTGYTDNRDTLDSAASKVLALAWK
jgi:hypothetical protein